MADARSDMNGLVARLRRKAFEPYIRFRNIVDQSLVKLSKRLKETFTFDATALQEVNLFAICGAARDAQKSFVGALEVRDKRLSFIVGHS